jgi:PAS domain S-box-containing protein
VRQAEAARAAGAGLPEDRMASDTAINIGSECEYMASIIDSSPVPLIALDTSLRIIMFNRAARDLTGFGTPDVMGCRISTLVGFADTRRIIRNMRDGGDPSGDHLTKFRKCVGGEVPVSLKVSPVTGRGGELAGAIILATDLTELRELQSKMLEAERVTAITETAISVNHEINNPLCSILGYTQLILMERDKLEPDVVSKLEGIEKQIVRIQEITDKLGHINKPVLKEYVGGSRMLDMEHSCVEEADDE